MRLSVVVATYEWPEALAAVLRALADQSDADFDVVVADDGSGPATASLVDAWRSAFGDRLVHVRQADEGYRLARVRNLGARAARGAFLVFLDGDVVPRRGFVAALRRSVVPGWFVAGKRVQLGRELSARVLAGGLPVHRWSPPRLALAGRGRVRPLAALTPLDRRRPGRRGLPEFVPHADGYGFLLGVARDDFVRVNGYDARYEGWGAEDVDMALRLRRLGLRCGWPGPAGTVLHLWHETRKAGRRPNDALLAETRESGRVAALDGLRELGV
ncbi:MAG TPA: glycosyltransferase [Gaiellaceae bacterium]|nr:glycosyltransferase [Gaiellaceae bacterium]